MFCADVEGEGSSMSWAANNSRLVSQWSQEREQLQGGWAPEEVAAAAASTSPASGGGMLSAFQSMPAGFQAASPGVDTLSQWDPMGDLGVGLQPGMPGMPGMPDEGGPSTGTWKDLGDMVMDGLDFLDSPDSGKPPPQGQLGLDMGLGPARRVSGDTLPEPTPEPEPAPAPALAPGKRTNDLVNFLEALNLPQLLPQFTRNELDLGALMLCTDEDLKEIGIPKGPRVKLRNGTTMNTLTSPSSSCPSDSPLTHSTCAGRCASVEGERGQLCSSCCSGS
eukprot:COSAG02_NODE_7930_length_2781_cov_2.454884_4_plen_278_part_00